MGSRSQGNLDAQFKWTYHVFWGAEDVAASMLDAWPKISTNKVIATMFPNDADGNALRPIYMPLFQNGGYTVVDGGAFQDGTEDFTARDRRLQESRRRDRHRHLHPAGLHELLEAGGPAGLDAQDRHLHQGSALPAVGGGSGRHLEPAEHRGVVVAEPSVQVRFPGSDLPRSSRPISRPPRSSSGRSRCCTSWCSTGRPTS